MPQDSFQLECDRLSHVVDGALYERLRWERNEGPILARLVELAHSVLEARPEFEFVEEGATRDIRRFVLKLHGNRVVGITLRVEAGRAIVEAHAFGEQIRPCRRFTDRGRCRGGGRGLDGGRAARSFRPSPVLAAGDRSVSRPAY